MRSAVLLLAIFSAAVHSGFGQTNSTATNMGPLQVVQKLFSAMGTHDAESARPLFIPEALLLGVGANGEASATPHVSWLAKWNSSKDVWLERIWNPTVLERGEVAVVWADYDFHLNGKFHHCGIDSFSLLKTAAGWKIASVSDTRETAGCKPSPLGEPKD